MALHKSPWHRGERELQERVGVAERMDVFGRKVIRDFMPDQHREFYQQLPFLVIATVDKQGAPWISLLASKNALAHSPDAKTLAVNAVPDAHDPVTEGLQADQAIGVLGIELHTRRRNRVNGRISLLHHAGFVLDVEHAFGNCPQYIQTRQFQFIDHPVEQPPVEISHTLDDEARHTIAQADTFFVASYVDDADGDHPRQIDASHRGGKAGFVRVEGNVLTIPDFAGNLHFNTLGNLHINPRAGLVFVNFANGDVLHLTGRTEIQFDGIEIQSFQGAERLWRFTATKMVRRRGALPLRWQFGEFSPNALMTGSWQEAEARQRAYEKRHDWRNFSIVRIVDESRLIKSFYLTPQDDAGLPPFKAGQHLPIRLTIPGHLQPVIRTYTLSSSPDESIFRISVKLEGVASHFLHQLQVGQTIEARSPQGGFTLDANEKRPAVLLAAGIGVTPLLAMLKHIVYEGLRTRRVRKTFFVYSARTKAERAFNDELIELVQRARGAVEAVRVLSAPEAEAIEGDDYEWQGRVDIEFLKQLLPLDDYDFYLCGPSSFTQAQYDGLRQLRIADDRLHAEQFGPSTLKRQPDTGTMIATRAVAQKPVPVLFAHSGKEARWQPGSGSLLELAESRGLTPEFSCRGGSCGTCKTKRISGDVVHTTEPGVSLEDDEILICCAQPANRTNLIPIVLEL